MPKLTLTTVLAALALPVVAGNMAMVMANRSLQAEVNGRAQFLQQTTQLEGLYREIAKSLAELAVRSNDTQVLQMLQAQGLTVQQNAPAPAAPAAPAPAAKR